MSPFFTYLCINCATTRYLDIDPQVIQSVDRILCNGCRSLAYVRFDPLQQKFIGVKIAGEKEKNEFLGYN